MLDNGGVDEERRVSWIGPRIVAAVLIVLGAVLIVQALGIAQSGGYRVVGPETFAIVVAIGILALGVAAALRTSLVPDVDLAERAAEQEAATHWPTIGLLAGLLLVYAVALNGVRLGPIELPGLGYIVATGVFLPVAARVLGSRHIVRDLAFGIVLAVVVYVAFTEFLGVRLPAGILEPLQ
jgi:putative tricarboxylic transport membrane protein